MLGGTTKILRLARSGQQTRKYPPWTTLLSMMRSQQLPQWPGRIANSPLWHHRLVYFLPKYHEEPVLKLRFALSGFTKLGDHGLGLPDRPKLVFAWGSSDSLLISRRSTKVQLSKGPRKLAQASHPPCPRRTARRLPETARAP